MYGDARCELVIKWIPKNQQSRRTRAKSEELLMDLPFSQKKKQIIFRGVIVTTVIAAVDVEDRDFEGGRSFHVI